LFEVAGLCPEKSAKSEFFRRAKPQSAHRAAMATFWRTFHHDGKISSAWWGWGGGVTPYPFHSIYHHEQSCCVSSLRGQILSYFSSTTIYILYIYSVRKTLGSTGDNIRGRKIVHSKNIYFLSLFFLHFPSYVTFPSNFPDCSLVFYRKTGSLPGSQLRGCTL
jgi:hypothetical protein